jgi:hypothetical protein
MDRTEKDAPNSFYIVACEFVAREVLIEPLLSNDSLHGASLAAVFRLLGIMSHVTHAFVCYCNGRLFWLH